jgi:hypothetical protein
MAREMFGAGRVPFIPTSLISHVNFPTPELRRNAKYQQHVYLQ